MITKKVILIDNPAPFVGTRLTVTVEDGTLGYGIAKGTLADGRTAVRVDWGDGTSETLPGFEQLTHAYQRAGTYEITLSDDLATLCAAQQEDDSPFAALYPPRLIGAFSNATRLTMIGPYCFRNAVNLATVDLADSAVTRLGGYSFDGCASLVALDRLPKGLETIVTFAFTGCTGLRRIENWPKGVAVLSSGDFRGCVSLAGEYDFVGVNYVRGSGNLAPFVGCTGGISAFHFAKADEARLTASSGYVKDPTLGTGTARCLFDR